MFYSGNTLWKNEKFSLTKIIFRQINSSNLFSETVTFTEFLQKMREKDSRNIHIEGNIHLFVHVHNLLIFHGPYTKKKYFRENECSRF